MTISSRFDQWCRENRWQNTALGDRMGKHRVTVLAWRRHPSHRLHRVPQPEDMRLLEALSGGEIRSDWFYDLPDPERPGLRTCDAAEATANVA